MPVDDGEREGCEMKWQDGSSIYLSLRSQFYVYSTE